MSLRIASAAVVLALLAPMSCSSASPEGDVREDAGEDAGATQVDGGPSAEGGRTEGDGGTDAAGDSGTDGDASSPNVSPYDTVDVPGPATTGATQSVLSGTSVTLTSTLDTTSTLTRLTPGQAPLAPNQITFANATVSGACARAAAAAGQEDTLLTGETSNVPFVARMRADNTFAWAYRLSGASGTPAPPAARGTNDAVTTLASPLASTMFAVTIPGSGAAPTVLTMTQAEIAVGESRFFTPGSPVPLVGGNGWAFGTVVARLGGVSTNSLLYVTAMTANDTIAWQTSLSDVGSKFKLLRLVPLSDGGLLVLGRRAGGAFPFAYDYGFIVRLDASGHVTWQRDYGDGSPGTLLFTSAVETASGIRALAADMLVANLGTDGAVTAARKYKPSAGAFAPVDVAKAAGGGLLLTAYDVPRRTFLLLPTAPDLGVTCVDAAVGVAVDPKTLPTEIGSLDALENADLRFTISSQAATTTPLTLTTTTRTPVLGNVCGQ